MTKGGRDDRDVPGHRKYLIYCDESGVGGQRYYGFGSLWLPWERRGDFAAVVTELRERHGYRDEIKWNKVKHRGLPFYRALVEEFFQRRWLMFHCLVVRRGYVTASTTRTGTRHCESTSRCSSARK